jgi:hypothetical protein
VCGSRRRASDVREGQDACLTKDDAKTSRSTSEFGSRFDSEAAHKTRTAVMRGAASRFARGCASDDPLVGVASGRPDPDIEQSKRGAFP